MRREGVQCVGGWRILIWRKSIWAWQEKELNASVAVLVQNGWRAESGWTRLDGHCIAAIVAYSVWTTLGTRYSHIASHIPVAAPLVIFGPTSAAVRSVEAHWQIHHSPAAMMRDSANENLMLTRRKIDCTNYRGVGYDKTVPWKRGRTANHQ